MNMRMQLMGVVILCLMGVALADDPLYTSSSDDGTDADVDDLLQEAGQLLEDRMMMEADDVDEVAEEVEDMPEDRLIKKPAGLIRWLCRLRTGGIVQHGKSVKQDCNTCSCRYGRLSCTKRLCPNPRPCRLRTGGIVQHGKSVKQGCNTCSCRYGRLSCTKRPCPPILKPACVTGYTYISLSSGRKYGSLQGVAVVSKPEPNRNAKYRKQRCSKMALLRVNFEKLTSDEQKNPLGCLPVPFCGRRMLRIDMTISRSTRAGHMFNFGDSSSNDGYNGDYGTQTNDAELHGVFPTATQYTSDRCKPAVNVEETFANVLTLPATRVTVWISNEHVRVQNNAGFDRRVCSRCLWALNGQADSTGPVNENMYLAINRVITRRNRYGVGICSVRLSWDCPSCMRSRPPFPIG